MKIFSARLFLFTLKRYLKKPAMLLLLAFLPLLTVLLQGYGKSAEEEFLCAAVCIETDGADTFASDTFRSALADYEGDIRFLLCESKESMQDKVIRREAECGYLVPADIFSRLLGGESEEAVKVYYAPSSALMPLVNEALYALLFSEISKEAVTGYLLETCAIHEQIAAKYTAEDIGNLYDAIRNGGATFHFQQEALSVLEQEDPEVSETASLLSASWRGLLSVFLLLSSLLGLADYVRLAKAPLFQSLQVRTIQILVPTILAAVDTFLCIWLSDYGVPLWKEAGALCLYGFSCFLLSFMLSFLLRNAAWLTAFLPLYLLSNLILCPVFADLGSFLPLLRILSHFFLPTYYLNLFS